MASDDLAIKIAAQEEVVRQARMVLHSFLVKYGLSITPRRDDPQALAFHKDAEAYKAKTIAIREEGRLYRLRHPDRVVNSGRLYRATNPEQAAQASQLYHAKNRDVLNESARVYSKEWYEEHKARALAHWRTRRARLAGAEGAHTNEEFRIVCQEFDFCCIYCGRSEIEIGQLTEDHIVPLIRGGSNSIENIAPACSLCNASKGDKTMEEYFDYLKLLASIDKGGLNG